jgi:hypothetical protein
MGLSGSCSQALITASRWATVARAGPNCKEHIEVAAALDQCREEYFLPLCGVFHTAISFRRLKMSKRAIRFGR